MMEAAADAFTCPIGALPDELLVAITSQLRVERGYLADEEAEEQRRLQNAITVRSLHALALSCRRFNAITTPFLYQCVIQTQSQPCMQVQLRTLMDKRDLAENVQYIEFETFRCSKQTLHQSPTESDTSRYRRQLVTAQWLVRPPETTSQLVGRIMSTGCGPDIIAGPKLCPILERLWNLTPLSAFTVLLSIVDNVQDIALPDLADILSLVVFKEYNHPGIFKRLWLKGSRTSYTPYSLRMMRAIPTAHQGYLVDYLRRILLHKSEFLETGPPPALEELSLDVYDTNAEDFSLHLRNCALLERFSCRWRWTDHFSPHYDVDLPALRSALQNVQYTLNHLTIDTMESAWLVDIERTIPPLGSLRDFKVLKYLNVTGLVLWGDDDIGGASPPLSALLPESLETLIVKTEWDDDVEDALHQLSTDFAAWLPALKKVECKWTPAPGWVADYLIDAYQLGGVELVLNVGDTEDA